jgi:hypothetical protein
MKKTALAGLYGALLLALPVVASAQALQPVRNFVVALGGIIDILIPILIALALVVFFWGLIQYIRKSGEGHAEGIKVMTAGLVALFIMVSVWGIINLAQNALGVNPGGVVAVPQVPTVTH